jgi:hypothetical protein
MSRAFIDCQCREGIFGVRFASVDGGHGEFAVKEISHFESGNAIAIEGEVEVEGEWFGDSNFRRPRQSRRTDEKLAIELLCVVDGDGRVELDEVIVAHCLTWLRPRNV